MSFAVITRAATWYLLVYRLLIDENGYARQRFYLYCWAIVSLANAALISAHIRRHRHSCRNRPGWCPWPRSCRRCPGPRYAFRSFAWPNPAKAHSRPEVTLSNWAGFVGLGSTRSTFQAWIAARAHSHFPDSKARDTPLYCQLRGSSHRLAWVGGAPAPSGNNSPSWKAAVRSSKLACADHFIRIGCYFVKSLLSAVLKATFGWLKVRRWGLYSWGMCSTLV